MQTKIKLMLDTRREKEDGTYPVKLYVYHKKQMTISTGYSAKEEDWANGGMTSGVLNWRAKNASLLQMLAKAEAVVLRLESEDKLNAIDNMALKGLIQEVIAGKRRGERTLIECAGVFMERMNDRTRQLYGETVKKIDLFDKGATFDSVTAEWLHRFEGDLKRRGLKQSSVAIHLRNIRAVFNWAIDNEVTTLYPFRKFKIKTVHKLVVEHLTVDQLRMLRDYDVEGHQRKSRDLFLLMFYLCGINFGDLCLLRGMEHGRVNFYRQKTGRAYSIKVEPEAMEIIKRYRGKEFLIDVLEVYKDYRNFAKKITNDLRAIGEMERTGKGGKKARTPLFPTITACWARYTWGTIAGGIEVPKETISAGLGHGARSVTDNYVHFDIKKVDEANRRVIDFLRG